MQVGVSCVRGLMTTAECRECRCDPMHPCMVPADVLGQLDPDPTHRHSDPNKFSASGLLGCYRQSVLQQEHPYYVDVDDAWASLHGTIRHAGIAAIAGDYPGAVTQFRELELQTVVATKYGLQTYISQPDLIVITRVEPTHQGVLYHVKIVDYKNTGEVKHELTAARKDHVRQINMYAWLVRRALAGSLVFDSTGAELEFSVDVDELEIDYGDFKKPRRFTSAGWLHTRGKMLTRSPRTYETIDLEPITIYPDEKVHAWVVEHIERKIESRSQLAPVLPEDEQWRCYYCPVKEVCDELAMGGM
jgi:hypothetical protein